MSLIDSHAHLTSPEFLDRVPDILARCEPAGVERVITIGTSLKDSRSAIELSRRYPGQVHAAVGFHPHEAAGVTEGSIQEMADLWRDPAVAAFGEMGLDYHYDFASREDQRRVFAGQLRWAHELDRPIVIHCREALDDTVLLLLDHRFEGRRVVFHCFTGTAEEAAKIASHGWRISFTGIVTFKRSVELQTIARAYPADQLMLETDSPYLSPEPIRSVRPNEPSHVAHIARFLAELRGTPYATLARQTADNTRRFFQLDEPARCS